MSCFSLSLQCLYHNQTNDINYIWILDLSLVFNISAIPYFIIFNGYFTKAPFVNFSIKDIVILQRCAEAKLRRDMPSISHIQQVNSILKRVKT